MPDAQTNRTILERQALEHRNRAEEVRTLGEATRSTHARQILLDLAKHLETLALDIEQRLARMQRRKPDGRGS